MTATSKSFYRPTEVLSFVMLRTWLLSLTSLGLIAALSAAEPPAQSPSPESPSHGIPRLPNVTSMATILNLGRGAVRIVAAISPTSDSADDGLGAIEAVLRENPSKRLRAYVFLTGAGEADTPLRATDVASRHQDRRIAYMWDPDAIAGTTLAPRIGLTGSAASDVIFIFDTDAAFTDVAPEPSLWMRTSPAATGNRLDAESLRSRVDSLVTQVERKASGGKTPHN